MEDKPQIRIWAGERKLLPIEKTATCYRYQCVLGEGYLRIMSSANRVRVAQGDEFTIPGEDIATLTAKQTMLIELKT